MAEVALFVVFSRSKVTELNAPNLKIIVRSDYIKIGICVDDFSVVADIVTDVSREVLLSIQENLEKIIVDIMDEVLGFSILDNGAVIVVVDIKVPFVL